VALSARLANHSTVLRLSWQWRTIRANQRNLYRVKTALFGNCDNLKQLGDCQVTPILRKDTDLTGAESGAFRGFRSTGLPGWASRVPRHPP
jgi:hypothetical protein